MADVNSEATDGGCEMCEVRDAGEKKENGVTATAHSFWIFGLWPATTTCPIRGPKMSFGNLPGLAKRFFRPEIRKCRLETYWG